MPFPLPVLRFSNPRGYIHRALAQYDLCLGWPEGIWYSSDVGMVEYIPCYSALSVHWSLLPVSRLTSREILTEQNIKNRASTQVHTTSYSLIFPCGGHCYFDYGMTEEQLEPKLCLPQEITLARVTPKIRVLASLSNLWKTAQMFLFRTIGSPIISGSIRSIKMFSWA